MEEVLHIFTDRNKRLKLKVSVIDGIRSRGTPKLTFPWGTKNGQARMVYCVLPDSPSWNTGITEKVTGRKQGLQFETLRLVLSLRI